MLNYTGTTYGYLTIKQDGNRFKIDIRDANCLCAFIHISIIPKEKRTSPERKYRHTLYSFFADVQHVKNIIKSNGGKLFSDEVVNISLNTFYKQSSKLLDIFTRLGGYEVTCYYKKESDSNTK